MEVTYACLEHPHPRPAHLEKSFKAEIPKQHLKPGVKYEIVCYQQRVFAWPIGGLKSYGTFKRALKPVACPSRRAGEWGTNEHKDSGHQSFS